MIKNFFSLVVLLLAFLISAETQPISSHEPQDLPAIDLISVEELQAKLAGNAKVTIIDVRASSGYSASAERIKGAIHVKLRRLRSRLNFSPLKDISRDQEVVTYCACPSDESSIAAARILLENGFKRVRALKGGWQEWKKVGGQTETRQKGD